MFGQTTVGVGGISSNASRVYRYEVVGLHQNEENDKNNYEIRRSGSVFVTVPYNRMNEEMQRIHRMGGKIVSIQPLTLDGDSDAKSEALTANQNLEAQGKNKAAGADLPKSSKGRSEATTERESES